MKSRKLNFLEPSGPLQACNGTALHLPFTAVIAAAVVIWWSVLDVTWWHGEHTRRLVSSDTSSGSSCRSIAYCSQWRNGTTALYEVIQEEWGWNHNHSNHYIQPHNRNYNNSTSTIHTTNTNCSCKDHQCNQGTTTTHKIMNKPTRSKCPLFKIANDTLVDLPTPSTVRGWWNFGSLLEICLVIQIATGLFLAIHYCPNIDIAFNRVSHICRDVNYGWLLRILHANGASLFLVMW
jgi:hypothetical protein